MKHEEIETRLGPATAIYNKGHLYILSLPAQRVGQTMFNISVLGLFKLEGADQPDRAQGLIDAVVEDFAQWFEAMPTLHQQAMQLVQEAGWPADLALPQGWFQFHATPQADGQVLQLMYYAAGPHLCVGVSADGRLVPKFSPQTVGEAATQARVEADRQAAQPLKHKVFGQFKPEGLVTLRRKRVLGKMISVDLYLPAPKIEGFRTSDLDPFVPVHDRLTDMIPALRAALAPLRIDWVQDWLDPLNADVAAPFHKAFPQARSGGLSETVFADALWLSRLCLCPYGGGMDGAGEAQVTWDFHALPKDKDSTVFVAITRPGGGLIDVTTES